MLTPVTAATAEAVPVRPQVHLRGMSLMVLVLTPEPPLADWLTEFDALLARSPGYFVGRPVVIDISNVPPSRPELMGLMNELNARKIRVLGLEGRDAFSLGADARGLPPILTGGRAAAVVEQPGEKAKEPAPSRGKAKAPAAALEQGSPDAKRASLVIDQPVRSGQSIWFPDGDVTVLGSVASGAEVMAGGSIHIYGALRGRAMAGWGNREGRIFCRSLEAELLAIDGLYKTADEIDDKLRGRAVQAWHSGAGLMIAALA